MQPATTVGLPLLGAHSAHLIERCSQSCPLRVQRDLFIKQCDREAFANGIEEQLHTLASGSR